MYICTGTKLPGRRRNSTKVWLWVTWAINIEIIYNHKKVQRRLRRPAAPRILDRGPESWDAGLGSWYPGILDWGPESWDRGQCTASSNACKSTASACSCILGSSLWLVRELGSLQPWRGGRRGMLLKEVCRRRSAARWACPGWQKLGSRQSGRCSPGCSSAPRSPGSSRW